MPEIGTSGSMSGDGKRSVAEWPKLPRPSSTLPERKSSRQIFRSNGSPTVFHVSNMGGYTCRALIFGLSFTNRVVPTFKQGSIS
jgi:hypothetical protein